MHVNRPVAASMALTTLLFLTSCALDKNWSYLEQLGLTANENVIPIRYDISTGSVSNGEEFLLYYYTTRPFDRAKPTVLFVAGGPGIVTIGDDDIVKSLATEYNVVYFHPRGSGFSQFPPSNWYDRYLRIKFAVEDINEILKDLGVERWEAIVAHSAGTVLAQQYAGRYSHLGKVRKLVLMAPLSRHSIASPKENAECKHDPIICAADKLAEDIRDKHRETLGEIYRHEFKNLNDYQVAFLKVVDKILHRVDEKFGNLPFVIEEYAQLRNLHGRDLLREHALDYSKPFFAALRQLRITGWLPVSDSSQGDMRAWQRDIGVVVARELACKMPESSKWAADIRTIKIRDGVTQETQERHSYCAAKDAINKLILDASSVSDGAGLSTDTDWWTKDLKKKQREALRVVFENDFDGLTDHKKMIVEEVENVLSRVEMRFGGLEYVINDYGKLSKGSQSVPLSLLKRSNLEYSLQFFKALQSLLYVKSLDEAEAKRQQLFIAVIVVKELAKTIEPLKEFLTRDLVIGGEVISYNDATKAINTFRFDLPTQWAKDMKQRQLEIVREMFDNRFNDLDGYQTTILQEAERILDLVENKYYGCLKCVIKISQDKELRGELQTLTLDFRLKSSVFTALQNLLDTENLRDASRARYVGAIIGKEIACRIATKLEAHPEFPSPMLSGTDSYCQAAEIIVGRQAKQSDRVYNVVSTYDGLHIRFLKEWLAGDPGDVRAALRKSAGDLHFERCGKLLTWWKHCLSPVNRYVEKVGIVDENIKAWDPGDYSHELPTLILEGGADPVTAGGQAEYIRDNALSGYRTLIRFPGVGHSMALPRVGTKGAPIGNNGPCLGGTTTQENFDHTDIRGCLIASFLEMDFEAFKKAKVLQEIRRKFQEMLKEDDKHRVQIFHCSKEPQKGSIAVSKVRAKDSEDRSSSASERAYCEGAPES
jgi:pimeloyl-ACP methyl ester carboxylesterase